MNLKDKVVFIAGGAGLLGTELSRTVAKLGAIIIIGDFDVEKAKTLASELTSLGLSAEGTKVDICDKGLLISTIDQIVKKHGRIDAFVNTSYPKNKNFNRSFFDVEYEDFCENLNLHLGGYFLASQQFAKFFVKQGFGNIINFASIYGVIAPKYDIYKGTEMRNGPEYAAIKSSLIHLTKYMAQTLKGTNVRVNCISPGGIFAHQPETFLSAYKDHCAVKGMLDPKDLADSLVFLLSDGSQFITGQNIVVDDGFTL